MTEFDAIILGAGGAGLMCAIHAGRRGRRVLVLDHAPKVGGKILISGGGRCNFTNLNVTPENFVSENPHFVKSALARYQSQDFLTMVADHQIPFYEKKLGQLFCERSARDIVDMLQKECLASGVEILLNHVIDSVEKHDEDFFIRTNNRAFKAPKLVVATGGLSIPKLGATDFGYRLARQFGHRIVERAPALDGFVLSDPLLSPFKELAGLSIDVLMSSAGLSFRENLLFTHRGLSGPAALQTSLHWRPGNSIQINLMPDRNFKDLVLKAKREDPSISLKVLLSDLLPLRFIEVFAKIYLSDISLRVAEVSEKRIDEMAESIHAWSLRPSSTVGYQKAEVTRGGVDTTELSSKSMESKKVAGLYFIGEVVDVTGWLGGYNFHWAWASGWSAAQAL